MSQRAEQELPQSEYYLSIRNDPKERRITYKRESRMLWVMIRVPKFNTSILCILTFHLDVC